MERFLSQGSQHQNETLDISDVGSALAVSAQHALVCLMTLNGHEGDVTGRVNILNEAQRGETISPHASLTLVLITHAVAVQLDSLSFPCPTSPSPLPCHNPSPSSPLARSPPPGI